MIPQMSAEEMTNSDFEKNIFYGPIKLFPKKFTEVQKDKFTADYRKLITTKIIPAYQKMATFLEKEYLPNAIKTNGINR